VSEHHLDAETALEPLTPTRWRGTIGERWWVVRGPFGGYVSTFLTRALIAAVDDPARRPRSLTVHFIEAPKAGPFEVSAAVERTGRSATTVNLRMEQDGVPVALALGSCATWRDGEPEWADAMPEAPPPEHCERLQRVDPMPGFLDNLEVRPVQPVFGGEARNLAWLRLEPPRPLDHLALTTLSDGWMPAAFSKLLRPFGAPTLDLAIHFRAPVPSEDWVLADYRSRFSAGGVWEEDGELWAPDGTLLAQSRQLALIRT
jgi:acyl-CoA thioesterase